MRVFAERQVIPTIYAFGMALERNPQAAETMARQGCDVVDQGWRWLKPRLAASSARAQCEGTVPRQASVTDTKERGRSGRSARQARLTFLVS
jgi:hypothetical protein